MDCNDGVEWLINNRDDSNSHWFTFVDPEGFSVQRELMEQLRDRGQMDILFNFQTTRYRRNSDENADGIESAIRNLGENFPRNASEDELVKWYEDSVFRDHGWKAKARTMISECSDWRYDLIFASKKDLAMGIINDIYDSDLKNDVTEAVEEARKVRGSGQAGFASFDVHNPDSRVADEKQMTWNDF